MSDELKNEAATGEDTPEHRISRGPRRWMVIGGVAVAVLALLGVGFSVWHKQPSFCGTVCHTPMTAYVDTYESDDEALLITGHSKNMVCIDCHEGTIDQQVQEGMTWVAGDYTVGDDGRIVTDVTLGTAEFCEECHDDYEEIVEATADWPGAAGEAEINPHVSHFGKIDCGYCHSMHGASTMYCNNCHIFELPVGWEDPESRYARSRFTLPF